MIYDNLSQNKSEKLFITKSPVLAINFVPYRFSKTKKALPAFDGIFGELLALMNFRQFLI